jgi:hypothetical protein
MILLFAALLAGVGVGYLRGGRWQALGSFRVRWPLLPAVAVALQIVLAVSPALRGVGGARPALLVTSYLLVGGWIWANALVRDGAVRRALIVVAEGWLLNVVVMVANGGMPVSESALARVGHAGAVVSQGHLWKHVVASSGTSMPLLGDVVPVPVPLLRSVISLGDVAMLVGLGVAAAVVVAKGEVGAHRVRTAVEPLAA